MVKKSNVHVVPDPSGGWNVEREGSERVSSHHGTQKDAIGKGRGTATREKVDLVIHDRKGRIRDKDSFGGDPCPPRDKRH